MANNNPFDNVVYAGISHDIRFGCIGKILACGFASLVMFATFILIKQEWFVHYVVHVPCNATRDIRYVALDNSVAHDCSRCRELKQRVINSLPPEERQKIKEIDRRNIEQARAEAQGHVEAVKRIEAEQKRLNDERWRRDLEYFGK